MGDRKLLSEDEQLEQFDKISAVEAEANAEAILKLFGLLPEWFPKPKHLQIIQALEVMRRADQSIDQIKENIARICAGGEPEYPGTVGDDASGPERVKRVVHPADFAKSIYELANFKWALSLPTERAIEELAGRRAAEGYARKRAQIAGLERGRKLRKLKITLERYEIAKSKARNRKELASLLGVSLTAVRDFEKKKNK
jgi:hypothetical protein